MVSRVSGVLLGLLAWGAVLLAPVWGQSASRPSEAQVGQWIEQLGSQDYTARQQAQGELAKLGFEAFEAISAATQNEDLEIASRARYLLGLMRMHWANESDPREIQQILRDYEFLAISGRLERIQALSNLRTEASVLALSRLVRYEASELLSKYAALEILNRPVAGQETQARLAQQLRTQLAASSRTAAKWVLTDEDLREKPAEAEAAWLAQVEAEQQLVQKENGRTNASIIVMLLYHLAEVQAQQGRVEQANATAQRARQLNPGDQFAQLRPHLEIALTLQHRGLFDWAEQEYQQVIQAKVPRLAFAAQRQRSEMWHDQGKDLAAAEALQQALAALEQSGAGNLTAANQTPEQLRARMYYFQACHCEKQGDHAQQLKYLEKALASDPREVDTLIAAWRFKEAPPELRAKVQLAIERMVAELRRDLGDMPDDADSCNLFAWLVSNTQGNLEEALRYSQRSLELEPNNGAYYDTLAHVYYAQGDRQRALESQTRANELEPHSGLILQELQRFRAESERRQGS